MDHRTPHPAECGQLAPHATHATCDMPAGHTGPHSTDIPGIGRYRWEGLRVRVPE